MKVSLYADEVREFKNAEGQSWMYLGVLAMPESLHPKAVLCLTQDRDAANYQREIKSTELTQRPKVDLAKLWMRRILHDKEKCFHFEVLGLNMVNLQRAAFGETRREQCSRIYNRFFRTVVSHALKVFFGNSDRIEVTGIFHDRTEMERNDLFDWHSIWRIQQEEDLITFSQDRIEFIDSDHEKERRFPEESHFIQLFDIILGSVRQCLDCTSERGGSPK